MDRKCEHGGDDTAALPPPPPPPPVPKGVFPTKVAAPVEIKRLPMARRDLGTKGQKLRLLTNHFSVKISNAVLQDHFYQYSVAITYEDGTPVEAKGIGRKILDKVYLTYTSHLAGKEFAYDGEKTLFTIGALPQTKLEFDVVLGDDSFHRVTTAGGSSSHGGGDADQKRSRRQGRSSTFKVLISYATKIPLQAIAAALKGKKESDHFQEAVRVLDIILRQHASKQGCLLVRQSFFHNKPSNFTPLDGGVVACKGFNSSFRPTQGGLSLNMDVSTTMIVQPGPVISFLLANQNVKHPNQIDWMKAKRSLKNLRMKTRNSNLVHKIVGLSDRECRDETFVLRGRNGDPDVELTVYEYFVNHRHIPLLHSGDFPCLNVGKPKRPTFFPVELCDLVSLQRYTKSLTNLQRSKLVRQKPLERKKALNDALSDCNYNADRLFASSGISVSHQFTPVEGRVLPPPKLRVGNGEQLFPRNGKWNLNRKKFNEPVELENWAIVNFSARRNVDVKHLGRDLVRCGRMLGMRVSDSYICIDESSEFRRAPAPVRVEKMFEELHKRLSAVPKFLLCILPERKNCDIYGPWKKKTLSDMPRKIGVVTQCVAPPTRVNDQYINNVLLKINAKMGGINTFLTPEYMRAIPNVSNVPTLIVGMDVSHGSPGRSDVPSIAVVVSSRCWPQISRYRAEVRSQSPKVELIDSLCKKGARGADEGTFRQLLKDFYVNSGHTKPQQIIIFRDGVSESQFNQVLNIELDQIMEACKLMDEDEDWTPKFMFIVAQKNHHTKFFLADNSPDNVPPGTVVDNGVCHPRNNDFYMCAHAGMIGTTRPTHYHVLYDEIGFSADDVQELVHNLSYVYQRSTNAISIVAPIRYAHLSAAQVSEFMKFEDMSETSSGISSVRGDSSVPQLPVLHDNVRGSMFFC